MFTNLLLNNHKIEPLDATGILKYPLSQTDTIILTYKQSMFSLEYNALVFSKQNKVKYLDSVSKIRLFRSCFKVFDATLSDWNGLIGIQSKISLLHCQVFGVDRYSQGHLCCLPSSLNLSYDTVNCLINV